MVDMDDLDDVGVDDVHDVDVNDMDAQAVVCG